MITKQIWKKIAKAKTITIFSHLNPDGDAYGSIVGLKHIILQSFSDKKVYVLGNKSERWETLLGSLDEVNDDTIKDSLAIILDVSDKRRVDDNRFYLAKEMVKIDHHIFVEKHREDSLEWVDTSFVATCEMIIKLAIDNNLVINKEAGLALYTGLITDSGRFLYPSVTKDTFKAASFIYETGFDPQVIYNHIYSSDEISLRFRGYCQQNFIKTNSGLVYNKINQKVLKEYGVDSQYAASIVNVLSNIRGVEIHVHFVEQEDGRIKVELRSKSIPVNEIATKFGGGGHKLAAGTIVDDFNKVDTMIDELNKLIESYS